jgi:hypothetical protein
MQREFSKELAEDRDFEIGGEVFRWRYPHWQETADLFDSEVNPEENGEFSFKADTELAIKRVPTFLDPMNDSHARWKKLVARKESPVPRHQIVQLYRWLVQETSGLPTQPPSASGAGGGDSATSSQGESS